MVEQFSIDQLYHYINYISSGRALTPCAVHKEREGVNDFFLIKYEGAPLVVTIFKVTCFTITGMANASLTWSDEHKGIDERSNQTNDKTMSHAMRALVRAVVRVTIKGMARGTAGEMKDNLITSHRDRVPLCTRVPHQTGHCTTLHRQVRQLHRQIVIARVGQNHIYMHRI